MTALLFWIYLFTVPITLFTLIKWFKEDDESTSLSGYDVVNGIVVMIGSPFFVLGIAGIKLGDWLHGVLKRTVYVKTKRVGGE